MAESAARAAVATAVAEAGPIRTGAEYIESLRGRKLKVYLFGEQVAEFRTTCCRTSASWRGL